jgi:hypothetical protein
MITTTFPNYTTGKSSATIAGLPLRTIEWNSDFKANKDQNNKWSGSESFTVNAEDVTPFIPNIGAPSQHPGFTFMTINSVDVNNNEGNTYVVTCNYGGITPSDDLNQNPDNTDTTTTSTSSVSSTSNSETQYTFGETRASRGLGVSVSNQPIQTHKKFKYISDADMLIIQEIKAGTYKKVKSPANTYIDDSDKTKVGTPYTFTDAAAIKLISYNAKGVTTYLVPNQIASRTYTSASLPNVGKVGYMDSPNGIGGGSANDWIFSGVNATKNGSVYEITEEWMKSGPSGWDPYLYSD